MSHNIPILRIQWCSLVAEEIPFEIVVQLDVEITIFFLFGRNFVFSQKIWDSIIAWAESTKKFPGSISYLGWILERNLFRNICNWFYWFYNCNMFDLISSLKNGKNQPNFIRIEFIGINVRTQTKRVSSIEENFSQLFDLSRFCSLFLKNFVLFYKVFSRFLVKFPSD